MKLHALDPLLHSKEEMFRISGFGVDDNFYCFSIIC
ncbi:hypothetical protein U27_00412 [Candidatus Vecturithrix granuli]|uniref:Uncharacterized protein n=1 Tax=Vecturithrix granuli TaxID=1499967 RepID=A0A081C7G0_VECG1|nr:hypothetical protein U27_00412 [Candidatus Vecturithrix granuli]